MVGQLSAVCSNVAYFHTRLESSGGTRPGENGTNAPATVNLRHRHRIGALHNIRLRLCPARQWNGIDNITLFRLSFHAPRAGAAVKKYQAS